MIVDTSAYSQFRNGVEPALLLGRQAPRLIMSPIVIGELLAGFRHGKRFDVNQADLESFLAWPHVQVINITPGTASAYASIYAELRAKGTPIPQNDLWLAALAREWNVSIWTYDSHFSHVAGLRVVRENSDLG